MTTMLQIKQADYESISRDFRGVIDGTRGVFAGSFIKDGGTRILREGVDFEIIPTPKTQPKKLRTRRAA